MRIPPVVIPALTFFVSILANSQAAATVARGVYDYNRTFTTAPGISYELLFVESWAAPDTFYPQEASTLTGALSLPAGDTRWTSPRTSAATTGRRIIRRLTSPPIVTSILSLAVISVPTPLISGVQAGQRTPTSIIPGTPTVTTSGVPSLAGPRRL